MEASCRTCAAAHMKTEAPKIYVLDY